MLRAGRRGPHLSDSCTHARILPALPAWCARASRPQCIATSSALAASWMQRFRKACGQRRGQGAGHVLLSWQGKRARLALRAQHHPLPAGPDASPAAPAPSPPHQGLIRRQPRSLQHGLQCQEHRHADPAFHTLHSRHRRRCRLLRPLHKLIEPLLQRLALPPLVGRLLMGLCY